MFFPRHLVPPHRGLALGAAALALTVAACGGDDDQASTSDKTSTESVKVPTEKAKAGGPAPAKDGGGSGEGAKPDVKALKRTKGGLEPAVAAAVQKQAGSKPQATFCGPTDIPNQRWTCTLTVGNQRRVYKLSVKGNTFSGPGTSQPKTAKITKKGTPVKPKRKPVPAIKGTLSS